MSDGILGVLQFAIDGVTERQNAVGNNIANAQTPNFTGTTVSFEQSLAQALAAPGPATATVSEASDPAAPNAIGNNVSLSDELVTSEKSALQFQTLSESLNAQFRLIAGSAGGSYT